MFKIELGRKVRDSITGFSGIVTGRCDYISGCRQYLVTPKAERNKLAESFWFDEDRLLKDFSKSKSKNKGGPQVDQAPIK